ncbi:unnamed protein product [Phytophthora fragariaefolia]|uniref:Unnamed protein product n=1 Tax=Phytophthora fragariaefolia TaxID=1490495 RepID=A0A9W7DAD8_9STRA|nr:unnamed protein product [Phytophthora fragariaefolia]
MPPACSVSAATVTLPPPACSVSAGTVSWSSPVCSVSTATVMSKPPACSVSAAAVPSTAAVDWDGAVICFCAASYAACFPIGGRQRLAGLRGGSESSGCINPSLLAKAHSACEPGTFIVSTSKINCTAENTYQ